MGPGTSTGVRGLYPNLQHSLLRREVDDRDEICLEFVALFSRGCHSQEFLLKKIAVGAKLLKTGRFKLGRLDIHAISLNSFYYTFFKIPGTIVFRKELKAIV